MRCSVVPVVLLLASIGGQAAAMDQSAMEETNCLMACDANQENCGAGQVSQNKSHSLAANPALRSYIDNEFGSTDNLIREILADFFRHGFDGSGADSYMDAGSCIDGVSMHSSRYHYSANQFLDHRG